MASKLVNWLKFYLENGYAIIPNVFTEDEINTLRCLAFKSFKELGVNIQWRNNFPALMFWPKLLQSYKYHPKLMKIVRKVLGDGSLHHLNHQYYFRMPGDGDEFAWHQDICFRSPISNFKDIEDGYLQTAIIVDDMDKENGGIHFIPGSHLKGDLELIKRGTEIGLRNSFILNDSKAVAPEVKSGSIMIWHVLAVHGSGKNESSRHRSYLMNGFAKSESIVEKSSYPVVPV